MLQYFFFSKGSYSQVGGWDAWAGDRVGVEALWDTL